MEQSTVLHGAERALVMVAVISAMFMPVLDTTIANVALPHMQASLGASSETVTWVLTSYIVASAIALPITGWLADRLGRRKMLVGSTIVFTIASVLCAISQSLGDMVLFRVAQGIVGAFIPPLVQSTLFDIHPPEEHGKAMSIFAVGIVFAPILGPIIGGWLTDNYSWRWVFLINLPIGIFATALMIRAVPRTPIIHRPFDLAGFFMIALCLASFQLMLDRGHTKDWFDSMEIWIEAGLAVAGLWMFAVHTATVSHPLFERRMLADRTFMVGMLFMMVNGALLLAGIALLPPLLQQLMGYSVLQSGYLTGLRGVGALISMQLAGFLLGKVDVRVLIAVGLVSLAYSLHIMSGFSLDMDWRPIAVSGFIQGFGIGMVFVPVQTVAFSTIPPQMRTSAASLFNLSRNVGGSVAIAIASSLLARNLQVSHADISQHVTGDSLPGNGAAIIDQLGEAGRAVLTMIDAEVNRQALFIAYLNDYWLMMWAALATLPLLLLLGSCKTPAQGGKRSESVHID